MKVLKNATQKNVYVEKGFYTDVAIKRMLLSKETFFFNEDFKECYDYSEYVRLFREPALRAFIEYGETLSVKYDRDNEMYVTILTNIYGNDIYVKLY